MIIFNFLEEEWELISREAKDLISKMLKYDPKLRYSTEECLKHNWFKTNESSNKFSTTLSATTIENMRKFKKENKLEQATITFIVTQIVSKEERNQLLSQFQSWDKDGNGVLSKDEIFEGFTKLYGDLKAKEEVVIIF